MAAVNMGKNIIERADCLPEIPELKRAVPGIIRNTRALEVIIHTTSPPWYGQRTV